MLANRTVYQTPSLHVTMVPEFNMLPLELQVMVSQSCSTIPDLLSFSSTCNLFRHRLMTQPKKDTEAILRRTVFCYEDANLIIEHMPPEFCYCYGNRIRFGCWYADAGYGPLLTRIRAFSRLKNQAQTDLGPLLTYYYNRGSRHGLAMAVAHQPFLDSASKLFTHHYYFLRFCCLTKVAMDDASWQRCLHVVKSMNLYSIGLLFRILDTCLVAPTRIDWISHPLHPSPQASREAVGSDIINIPEFSSVGCDMRYLIRYNARTYKTEEIETFDMVEQEFERRRNLHIDEWPIVLKGLSKRKSPGCFCPLEMYGNLEIEGLGEWVDRWTAAEQN